MRHFLSPWTNKSTDCKYKLNCRFISTSIRNGPGFEITYEAKECGTDVNAFDVLCRSVCRDYSAQSGLLNSPYYPIPYTDGAECIYKISHPHSTYINMTFSQFDVYNNDIFQENNINTYFIC